MSKFKVGDKVYHVVRGVGVVVLTPADGTVHVDRTDGSPLGIYSSNGYFSLLDTNPSILTIPEARAKGYDVPKVKRKVTKTISRWANVYPDEHLIACNDYRTREEADSNANLSKRIACVELTGTYEVEEEA